MKKISFKKAYLIFSVALALIVVALLFLVYRILYNYEHAQAHYIVEDYVNSVETVVRENDTFSLNNILSFDSSVRFSDKDELTTRFLNACKEGEFTYQLSSKSFDANNPLYDILCNDRCVAQIELTLKSEKIKLGFLSIPDFGIQSTTPVLSSLCDSYTLTVPSGFSLKVNGTSLTEEDIISDTDGFLIYYIEGLCTAPQVQVYDSFNEPVSVKEPELILNAAGQDSGIFSIEVGYERFDMIFPSNFTVRCDGLTPHSITEYGYTTYSIFSANKLEKEFLEKMISVLDPVNNPVSFHTVDGKILPVYREYMITVPNCYRVYANDYELTEAVNQTALTEPQYREQPLSLLTYRIGLAKKTPIRILDENNNLVSYEQTDNTLRVPQRDITVTIPDNFKLLINGKSPEVTPESVENNDYRYLREYITAPGLKVYQLKGLATTPCFTVIDNQGNSKDYKTTEDLEITAQTGLDSLPQELSTQLNPLDIAKKWSLFMTNDLSGSLNGYYAIREYLIRDSYYDTVAYQWATNIDITFISDHYFRNPAFSNESISNVVLYNDLCFSCDITFEKHMTLTKTGKLQDDLFHRRVFFLYLDDTEDAVDNPHWVIADMQDI